MFEQSSHTMELACTYTSGAEEWHCPTCGRRMIMQWPPKYKRIVLEPGDELAAHASGKGGLQIGSTQVTPADELLSSATPQDAMDDGDDEPLDHEALGPWLKWLSDANLDEVA